MDSAQRKGNFLSVSPSQTPRSSDKPSRDHRVNDANGLSNSRHDKDKGVNVQVILRCKPLSEDEKKVNTPVVVSCNEHRREVSAIQSVANKIIDKTFNFDRVFGPSSQQKDLFDLAVSPIVNEVLDGYNCTIFAYGQTGTGKTYTMEGGRKAKSGEFLHDAGVIPRAVRQIFETLEAQNAEYNMKVTFLELYNEEITDLLAPDELKIMDDKSKKPIALMEDGKGGVFVRGLEEEMVSSANEIYKILDKGSSKRRTAETLLNKQSSRSHSIFSITIHMKEYTHEGEEMIKCGKLNLVDLAGSENISRSGAREGRAREAGEINKSLLTLGRVINALVDHSGHIPYRDSKLTRLLRDSLGGKTKTCIIATVSPSIHCLEETLNTLDYAHRAKSIKNRPEINQKVLKSAMMKDLCCEIDRLKQELYAAREKNGIYMPRDRFLQEEAEKKAMVEKIERLELDLELKDKKLIGLQELYNSQQLLTSELSNMLEKTQKKLEGTERGLTEVEEKYKQANLTIKEKEYLVSNLLRSEKSLLDCAFELRSDLDSAASDVSGLFSKIERKDKTEEVNKVLVQNFRVYLDQQLKSLHATVSTSVVQQETQMKKMEEDILSFLSSKTKIAEEVRGRLGNLTDAFGAGIGLLSGLFMEMDGKSLKILDEVNGQVSDHFSALADWFKKTAFAADQLLNELKSKLQVQEENVLAFSEQLHAGFLRNLENTRSISNTTAGLFKSLDVNSSNLIAILEETITSQERKLLELETKFEECAASEEKELIVKISAMLASSSARKKNLVKTTIDSLRENAAARSTKLHEEMKTARNFTSEVKRHWTSYVEQTEKHYEEDIASVLIEKSTMQDRIRDCVSKTLMGSEQWIEAQDSILALGKGNTEAVGSIVRKGQETNLHLRSKLSVSASSVGDDAHAATKDILSFIDHNLKLDRGAWRNVSSLLGPCLDQLEELRSGHDQRVMEINAEAGKCLEEEYLVYEPSCSTPRRRDVTPPSIQSIEVLKTRPFEDLLREFREVKSAVRMANGDSKYLHDVYENSQETMGIRDSRPPLVALN